MAHNANNPFAHLPAPVPPPLPFLLPGPPPVPLPGTRRITGGKKIKKLRGGFLTEEQKRKLMSQMFAIDKLLDKLARSSITDIGLARYQEEKRNLTLKRNDIVKELQKGQERELSDQRIQELKKQIDTHSNLIDRLENQNSNESQDIIHTYGMNAWRQAKTNLTNTRNRLVRELLSVGVEYDIGKNYADNQRANQRARYAELMDNQRARYAELMDKEKETDDLCCGF